MTFENGNLVSQTKYKAWGEVRYQSGPSLTEYGYTGQYSYTGSFGLMYYNARWYDPALGRLCEASLWDAQADSIVPPGVQGLDRYAYTFNNPIRYVDPSGHETCEGANWDDGPKCTQKAGFWQKAIKDTYDWNADPDFSLKDLKTIYQTGRDIEDYVDSLTGGKGQDWMKKYLGGTTITPWSGDGAMALPGWIAGTNTIYLNSESFNSQMFAHELGHIWDMNTSNHLPCACGVYGGVADQLNIAIGGNPFILAPSIRWWNDRNGIPSFTVPENVTINGVQSNNWFTVNNGYGNNSTADYLAETFSLNIYKNGAVPAYASAWVDVSIIAQANALP